MNDREVQALWFRILAWSWFKAAPLREWKKQDDAARIAVGADEWADRFLAS